MGTATNMIILIRPNSNSIVKDGKTTMRDFSTWNIWVISPAGTGDEAVDCDYVEVVQV
jgi:hypothetical protein